MGIKVNYQIKIHIRKSLICELIRLQSYYICDVKLQTTTF